MCTGRCLQFTVEPSLEGPPVGRTLRCRYLGSVVFLAGELTGSEASDSWQSMPSPSRSQTTSILENGMEQSAYLLADLQQDNQADFTNGSIREWLAAEGRVC